jgi:uncharacterized protein
MAELRNRLEHDLKDAMRAKDRTCLLTIRSLLAAITSREKEGSGPVSDEQEQAAIAREAKQRRDAIAQYEEAGRTDLAEKEAEELAVIENYLPKQLSDDEVREVIREIIEQTGATSKKDLGAVMGQAMGRLRGRADGNKVRQTAEVLLGD